jgi:hypothetical protein
MLAWLIPGGWAVEVVRLSGTPDKHNGEWIRVGGANCLDMMMTLRSGALML